MRNWDRTSRSSAGRAGAATLTLRPAHVKTTARRRAVQRRSGREEQEVHPLCWNGQSPCYQDMNVQCRHSLLLATSQRFQFIERSRPVGSEKPRQATVSQHFAAGLTTGAVVGLVIGIANALDLLATARAGLVEASVHSHLRPESRHSFWEFFLGFGLHAVNPEL